jgi:hypothetical protein
MTMKLKINNVPGFAGVVTIQTDNNGVPLEKFWRNRLKDAEIDNCVEVVKSSRRKSTKESAE